MCVLFVYILEKSLILIKFVCDYRIINNGVLIKFGLISSFLGLCICMTFPAYGQYLDRPRVQYNVNDGLPSSTCYDIVIDERGFLWVATEGGLTRYDGFNFKTLTTSDGLLDNEIVNLQSDKKGRIWMNTNGTLSFIKNESIQAVPSEQNTTLKWSFKIHEDNHDILWISRVNDIFAYNARTLEAIEFQKPLKTINSIYSIAGIYQDAIWIAHGNKVFKYNGTQIIDSLEVNREDISDAMNRSFFQISSPDLYFLKGDVLWKLNLETKAETKLLRIDAPIRQLEVRANSIWVLTQNSLSNYETSEQGAVLTERLFEGEFCSRFLIDEDENLWAAMYKSGLIMISPTNKLIEKTTFDKLGSNKLQSLFVKDGKILAGSEVGDIYVIKNGKTQKFSSVEDKGFNVNRVIDIIPLPDGGYLISKDTGVYFFKDGQFRHLINTNSKNIFYRDGKVLLNAYNRTYITGLDKILSIDKPIVSSEASQKLDIVEEGRSYSSIIDSQGRIWNSNVITGLSVRTDNETFYYKSLSKVFNCTVSRIMEMDDGVICAVTKGEGLILIKDKAIRHINETKGLSSNFCYDIDVDGNKIYVATNKGVSIVELEDFESLTFKVRTVDRHNGLPADEIFDVQYEDDKMYLASNEGLLAYQLTEEEDKHIQKQIFIEEFIVNAETRTKSDSYKLSARENNIRIKYTSPDISFRHKSLYAYKLEGVDEDWITTTSTETHYSNIKSGKYKFLYKSALSNSDDAIKSISIEIEPKFVQSSMFKVIMLMGLGLLFMVPMYLSYNTQKRNLLASLLDKKSGELNDKMRLLQKTNKSLVESNKELEQFAYIASHDLQEPINTIKGFSEILTKQFEASNDKKIIEMLSIINDSSARMKELVKALLVYSRIGKEKKKSMVDVNALLENIKKDMTDRIESNNAKIEWGNLPYIPGYEVELRSLFQNLLSNAMKFQKPGTPPEIKISSRKLDNAQEFSIKDNGIGISKEHAGRIFEIFQRLHNKDQYEGTGIGLAHCKKIVNLHNGNIWVESEVGEGCNFKFTIEA